MALMLGNPVLAWAGLSGTPVEQWRWDGWAEASSHPYCVNTCIVVPFSDTNGDTLIDGADGPDVLIPSRAVVWPNNQLQVLEGATGAVRRRMFDDPDLRLGLMSAGDVDRDGRTDLITYEAGSIVAHRDDGTSLFQRTLPESVPGYAALNLADIDQDGLVDVVVGRMALLGNGTSWIGTGGMGRPPRATDGLSVPIEFDAASPGLEIVAGNTVYSSTGSIRWQAPVLDGFPAVGDILGVGEPQVVLLTRSDLYLIDGQGTVLGGNVNLYVDADLAVNPILADIDADGQPEVIVACNTDITAYEWNGSEFDVAWTQSVRVAGSQVRPTAFDFDCDGAAEIVYRDEDRWYIFEGRDGAVLHSEPFPSGTLTETPVVVNLDDDPWAEIVVPSHGNIVIAYEIPNSATPRPIFNQITYHGTNILDDGSIPLIEPPSWQQPNTYMAQQQELALPPCVPSCPGPVLGDVVATDPNNACSLDLLVAWDPASFPSGDGTYHLYRSDDAQGLTCADALSRGPVASDLSLTSWRDTTTQPGRTYVYVVEAEDAIPAEGGCGPVGRSVGGMTATACTTATTETGQFDLPAAIGAVLRVRRGAGEVVLSWPTVRPLLAGEHFHVRRFVGRPPATFLLASAEGMLDPTWREPLDTSPLILYDLRIANGCEDESLDEAP